MKFAILVLILVWEVSSDSIPGLEEIKISEIKRELLRSKRSNCFCGPNGCACPNLPTVSSNSPTNILPISPHPSINVPPISPNPSINVPPISPNPSINVPPTPISPNPSTNMPPISTNRDAKQDIVRIGCYRDKGRRQLGNTRWIFGPSNSQAACIASCRQAGYKYAAPENGNECHCGHILPPEKISDSNCNVQCRGIPSFYCGGYWALEVFETNALQNEPSNVRIGCYQDRGRRQLGNTRWIFNKSNSPAVCVAACRQAGHKYAAPENGNECHCGNLLPSEEISDSRCNVKCRGVPSLSCGGYWALEVFETGL